MSKFLDYPPYNVTPVSTGVREELRSLGADRNVDYTRLSAIRHYPVGTLQVSKFLDYPPYNVTPVETGAFWGKPPPGAARGDAHVGPERTARRALSRLVR